MTKRSAAAVYGGRLARDNFAAAKFDPQKNVAAIVKATVLRAVMGIFAPVSGGSIILVQDRLRM